MKNPKKEKPVISIVLGSYNRKQFLKRAIRSIRNNGITVPYEIVVIDGGSTDGSIKYLTSQKDVVTIVHHNNGFWKGEKIEKQNWGYYMNKAFRSSHGKYIVMISDDCLLVPGSVMNAYILFEEKIKQKEKVGAIAFYWKNNPYEKMYYVRQTLGHKLSVNHGMYLKQALIDVNFCDEDNYPFYYGDGDLSLEIWHKGYKIIDCKKSFVEHFHFATMNIRKQNSERKKEQKKIYTDKWEGLYYDKEIDNQSGKIFLKYDDPYKTSCIFKKELKYYIGILQSKFGKHYGYEKNRPDRLPSVEMLSNPLNIKYLLSKLKINQDQLCFFALIKKNNKILMGSREYKAGDPKWTYPGGRCEKNETMKESLTREVFEETGIKNFRIKRVVGQKQGVLKTDRVYFIECETDENPKLMEPEKFNEWRWFEINKLPSNIMDQEDINILKRIF